MDAKDLEQEIKYLEIFVEQLKLMMLNRKRKAIYDYKTFQCTDSDVRRVCSNIRKSSLVIKRRACQLGMEK